MPASATDRFASINQINFLNVLRQEREDFGYDPEIVYSYSEADDLIRAGKMASRKVAKVDLGYYIKPDKTVWVVVESKDKPGRRYAKLLVIRDLIDRHTGCPAVNNTGVRVKVGKWRYVSGGIRSLVGVPRLTEAEAAELGKQHGVCVVCAKTLTDPKSVAVGIGPVCSKNLRNAGVFAAEVLAELPEDKVTFATHPLIPAATVDTDASELPDWMS